MYNNNELIVVRLHSVVIGREEPKVGWIEYRRLAGRTFLKDSDVMLSVEGSGYVCEKLSRL